MLSGMSGTNGAFASTVNVYGNVTVYGNVNVTTLDTQTHSQYNTTVTSMDVLLNCLLACLLPGVVK